MYTRASKPRTVNLIQPRPARMDFRYLCNLYDENTRQYLAGLTPL
jgi:hypothetical protein